MSWYMPETFPERMLNLMMRPLSALYYLGAGLRLTSYRAGLLPRQSVDVPIISVGNLTVGGTGKTPVVIDLAKRLIHEGYKVGIISRGYRRKVVRPLTVVSDGKALLAEVDESGDEPFMMATACPRAVVVVGTDRPAAARLAVQEYGCNVLLLDDGFQHLRLRRLTDVVLLDYNDDVDGLKLLPAGRLREPLSSLSRADWVVISKVPANPCPARMERMRAAIARWAPRAKVTSCSFEPDSVHQLYAHENVSVCTQVKDHKVLAFCGVARPENFFDQLGRMGATVVARRAFPDHHWLSESDTQELLRLFASSGAQIAVTTAKDAVRLPVELIERIPVAKLRQRTIWLGDVPLPVLDKAVPERSAATSKRQPALIGERR